MFLAIKPYFSIGSLDIHFYAICIMIGVMLAVWHGLYEAKKLGIPSDVIYVGVLIIVPLSIVGARIWYVIYNVSDFNSFGEVLGFYNGKFTGLAGLGIQGGIIAAVISIVVYCKKRDVPLYIIFDIVAPGFLIGQICGRWGNFFNQELYGPIVQNPGFLKAIPILGKQMYITDKLGTYYRHPCFLYEGTLNLIGVGLMFLSRRKLKQVESGDLMGFYLVWYGMVRIPIEILRLNSGVTDPLFFTGTKIPVSIVTSVLFIVGGIAFLVLKRTLLTKFAPRRSYMEIVAYVAEHHVDTLIFDLDGTLLDTRPLIDRSFIHTFEKFRPGYELSEEELDSFFGPTLQQSFSKYSEDQEEIDQMIAYYREYNLEIHDEFVKAFPGAKELLKMLHNKKYNIAVVSSKKKDLVLHGLEFTGLAPYIDVVLGSDDVTVPKPDPEGIKKALIALNEKRENPIDDCEYLKHAVYIGDTASDILAAKNAGIRSVGVLYIKKPEIMLENTPDFVINKLMDLVSICGE